MSASPVARSPRAASGSPARESSQEAGPSRASKSQAKEPGSEDEDEDDLFGEDGAAEEDDDDDEDAVATHKKQRRRPQTASPAGSSRRGSLVPSSAGSARSKTPEDRYAALEHRETSVGSPMGHRDIYGEDVDTHRDEQVAEVPLPSLPVRRGAPHFFARLPNLLQYRSEVFDEKSFDDTLEDEQLQSREGIRIDDKGLRSLLISSNTIRWRRTDEVDSDGAKIRESNARIVKWSDGSSSLQLGSEFYDISLATERIQGAPAPPHARPHIVPPQPVQHLTHLFVKHDGQDQVNLYQAETPILGSMMFRPTSISSESHQRLAKAVRKQKGTLVKETTVREDPEAEKERLEKEQRKAQQKRQREARKRQKAMQGEDDDDDDAFWSNTRTTRRVGGGVGQSGRASDMYEDDDVLGDETMPAGEQDDDGFVVDDEEDGAAVVNGAEDDGMDVDEPDEMDRMEAKMERQEARRRARESDRRIEDQGGADDTKPAADASTAANARRRRIVEESDEE